MCPDTEIPLTVDVWSMETAAFSANRWIDRLAEGERDRAARFLHRHDQRDYVAAHLLTRNLLAHLGAGDPATLGFASGPYGKPRLAETGRRDWRFNLTHTDGFVAVAATEEAEVGIDAEALDRSHVDPDLARTVFTDAERKALGGMDGPAWRREFFRLWTLKESVIKMLGTGLSTPLDSIQVCGDPPWVEFRNANPTALADCFLHVETPTTRHILSLCVGGTGHPVAVRRRILDAATLAIKATEGRMSA